MYSKQLLFPTNNKIRYYKTHWQYLIDIFNYLCYNITYHKEESNKIYLNGKEFYFDIADYSNIEAGGRPLFKYHCAKENIFEVYPITPISFYDWNLYYILEKTIKFKAAGHISNRQIAYGNASQRRSYVRNLLTKKYHKLLEHDIIPKQIKYWESINDMLVAVCVPGQNNNMLDRGQLQLMAFGTCTISPNLPEYLPFNKQLMPDVDYIRCNDDYSDLIDKIEWVKAHPKKAIDIGQNAKELFQQTSVPEKIEEWILFNLKGE